ncbi:MAG: DUF2442 domain-containing protein [Sphingobacteriaceae bacterium]|nr:MAG: DUF2442 domain-containing protein [Sphingobacteriaceae bacterium]
MEDIYFEQDLFCLKVDGKLVKLPLAQVSKKLVSATEIQRNFFKISPSGYGIHWPLLDEDLSVDFMLKVN